MTYRPELASRRNDRDVYTYYYDQTLETGIPIVSAGFHNYDVDIRSPNKLMLRMENATPTDRIYYVDGNYNIRSIQTDGTDVRVSRTIIPKAIHISVDSDYIYTVASPSNLQYGYGIYRYRITDGRPDAPNHNDGHLFDIDLHKITAFYVDDTNHWFVDDARNLHGFAKSDGAPVSGTPKNIALIENAHVVGLATDGTLYSLDSADKKIYKIDDSGKLSTSLTLASSLSSEDPRGLTFVGSTLYLLTDTKIHLLNRNTGRHNVRDDITLPASITNPNHIAYHDLKLWILDGTKVVSLNTDGTLNAPYDFDLHPSNTDPRGLTYASNRFLVPDGNGDVYGYTLGTGDKFTVSGKEFTLHSTNSDPGPITASRIDSVILVADKTRHSVFAYDYFTYRYKKEETQSLVGTLTNPTNMTGDATKLYIYDHSSDMIFSLVKSMLADPVSYLPKTNDIVDILGLASDGTNLYVWQGGKIDKYVIATKVKTKLVDIADDTLSFYYAKTGDITYHIKFSDRDFNDMADLQDSDYDLEARNADDTADLGDQTLSVSAPKDSKIFKHLNLFREYKALRIQTKSAVGTAPRLKGILTLS